MDAAVTERGGDGLAPLEAVRETHLLDHRNRMRVRAEDVVVGLLEPDAWLDLEASGQSARQRLPLDHRHVIARMPQPHGRSERKRAGTQDRRGGQDRSPARMPRL